MLANLALFINNCSLLTEIPFLPLLNLEARHFFNQHINAFAGLIA